MRVLHFIFWYLLLPGVVSSCTASDHAQTSFLKDITWMHIQKTSSWLGDFLLLWACPALTSSYNNHITSGSGQRNRVFFYDKMVPQIKAGLTSTCPVHIHTGDSHCNYGFHEPYRTKYAPVLNHTLITVFRKPEERLISAFLFNGMMIPLGSPWKLKARYIKAQLASKPHPILHYANLSGIASCQTKMVLGYNCGVAKKLTAANLLEVNRRLRRDFAFVGLTEESEATAALFLAMFGSNPFFPVPASVSASYIATATATASTTTKTATTNLFPLKQPYEVQYREGSHHGVTRQQLLQTLRAHQWKDWADQHTYQEAQRLFYVRCRVYGIETKHNFSIPTFSP